MHSTLRALLVSSVFLATACRSTRQETAPSNADPHSGMVRGVGGGINSFLSIAAFAPTKEIWVTSVNGDSPVKAVGEKNAVRLAVGLQQLAVQCQFMVAARLVQSSATVALDVIDGHAYQLDAQASVPCGITVTDLGSGGAGAHSE